MNGEERRNQIVDILKHSSSPVPGTQLAQILDVSRQVIVQDIALIRAKNIDVSQLTEAMCLMISRSTAAYLRLNMKMMRWKQSLEQ